MNTSIETNGIKEGGLVAIIRHDLGACYQEKGVGLDFKWEINENKEVEVDQNGKKESVLGAWLFQNK